MEPPARKRPLSPDVATPHPTALTSSTPQGTIGCISQSWGLERGLRTARYGQLCRLEWGWLACADLFFFLLFCRGTERQIFVQLHIFRRVFALMQVKRPYCRHVRRLPTHTTAHKALQSSRAPRRGAAVISSSPSLTLSQVLKGPAHRPQGYTPSRAWLQAHCAQYKPSPLPPLQALPSRGSCKAHPNQLHTQLHLPSLRSVSRPWCDRPHGPPRKHCRQPLPPACTPLRLESPGPAPHRHQVRKAGLQQRTSACFCLLVSQY
jgi:hypothetical protein